MMRRVKITRSVQSTSAFTVIIKHEQKIQGEGRSGISAGRDYFSVLDYTLVSRKMLYTDTETSWVLCCLLSISPNL